MRFGVLGAGFGMYGWIPAIATLPGAEIATLEKYRDVFKARKELGELAKRIEFVAGVDELIDRSDSLVVAQRPRDHVEAVNMLARTGWKGTVVVEKPLAPRPEEALALIETAAKAGIRLVPGFSIAKTEWAYALAGQLAEDAAMDVQIDWRFEANHYAAARDTWKRRLSEGGGALRFYAIHLIAWLAQTGPWEAVQCRPVAVEDDAAVEFSVMRGKGKVSVRCDSRYDGAALFSVRATRAGATVFGASLKDPFEDSNSSDGKRAAYSDRRIPYLIRILKDVAAGGGVGGHLRDHVLLWEQLESLRDAGG
jgi:predicted dehydrogenase